LTCTSTSLATNLDLDLYQLAFKFSILIGIKKSEIT
jgi:hypothetical protein